MWPTYTGSVERGFTVLWNIAVFAREPLKSMLLSFLNGLHTPLLLYTITQNVYTWGQISIIPHSVDNISMGGQAAKVVRLFSESTSTELSL